MTTKRKKRGWPVFVVLLGGYLLSGLYIVRGNEQGIVRRCGRMQRGTVGPGLHYDLPWPFAKVDRVNRNEIRTLMVGLSVAEETTLASFDAAIAKFRQGEFLTGDKNVLLLAAQIQYRIVDPPCYLFSTENPERLLRNLAESAVTSIVSRSGVDYVHPLGLNELRASLTVRLQELASERNLGVEIEDVALSDVRPPALVKQSFLDVSNARAERARLVSEAQTVADRMLVQAGADAQKIRDEAAVERQTRIAIAHGESERFLALQRQIPGTDGAGQGSARRDAMEQMYLQTLGEMIPALKGRIFADGERPIDLSIWDRSIDEVPDPTQPTNP